MCNTFTVKAALLWKHRPWEYRCFCGFASIGIKSQLFVELKSHCSVEHGTFVSLFILYTDW